MNIYGRLLLNSLPVALHPINNIFYTLLYGNFRFPIKFFAGFCRINYIGCILSQSLFNINSIFFKFTT